MNNNNNNNTFNIENVRQFRIIQFFLNHMIYGYALSSFLKEVQFRKDKDELKHINIVKAKEISYNRMIRLIRSINIKIIREAEPHEYKLKERECMNLCVDRFWDILVKHNGGECIMNKDGTITAVDPNNNPFEENHKEVNRHMPYKLYKQYRPEWYVIK